MQGGAYQRAVFLKTLPNGSVQDPRVTEKETNAPPWLEMEKVKGNSFSFFQRQGKSFQYISFSGLKNQALGKGEKRALLV